MAQTNFNTTYNTAGSVVNVSIPNNAFNISLTVGGGRGGNGCQDGGPPQGNGRPGGSGIIGTFTLPNYTARTLTLRPGGSGQQRTSQCGGCDCAGGASSFGASGGRSGTTGGGGSSGAGGGGGGATIVYDSLSTSMIIVAGGGGGGAGGSMGCDGGSNGGDAGGFVATTGFFNPVAGDQGGDAVAGDGGSGGGGGGGTSGGSGGGGGVDFCGPIETQIPLYDENGNITGYGTGFAEVQSQGGGGGGSGYRSNITTLTSQSTNGGTGFVTLTYTAITPEIQSFTANPNPQNSVLSGIPQYSTQLQWAVVDANLLTVTSSIGETWNVTGTSTLNITNLPQSNANTNSPATRTYTLTACFNTFCVTSNVTVQVRNDNTPNSFSLPSTTTTGVALNNLEPNTLYQIQAPIITGIDMVSSIITTASAGLEASLNGSNWSSVVLISNNQSFLLRFTSPPFNTDPAGLSNPRTYNYTIGSISPSFNISTRVPDVGELFDFGDSTVNYPFPDIDTVANTPQQYITSPTTITMGDSGRPPDAEIPVEIKSSNPDIQIRIKPQGSSIYNDWQNIRQI